jgi:hypothetical protein
MKYSKVYNILFILGICILLLLFLNNTIFIEKMQSNTKYYFISFGGPTENYYNALNRIYEQVKNLNIFDFNIKYTDINLKNDHHFWQQHQVFIENNKRGYGYWLWKPYIILQTLNIMQDNEILLYADAGCEIMNNPEEMKQLLKNCDNNELLYSSTPCIERQWNKRDLLNYMDMDKPHFINTLQSQATFILIKKNVNTFNFIKEWYDIASTNYHFIDDSSSILQNYDDFIEHRHDQSIFSLLTKKFNLNNDNNILHNYQPIITARNR